MCGNIKRKGRFLFKQTFGFEDMIFLIWKLSSKGLIFIYINHPTK